LSAVKLYCHTSLKQNTQRDWCKAPRPFCLEKVRQLFSRKLCHVVAAASFWNLWRHAVT